MSNKHAFNKFAAKEFGGAKGIVPALVLGYFMWLEENHSKVHVRLDTQCVLVKKTNLYSMYFYIKPKEIDTAIKYLEDHSYIKEIDRISDDQIAYTISSAANELCHTYYH